MGTSHHARSPRFLEVDGHRYAYMSLADAGMPLSALRQLPRSLKVLLENLLRHHDGQVVTAEQIARLAGWASHRRTDFEVAYHPNRVLMPDSSGTPLLNDLSAMRAAIEDRGADPSLVNPLVPVDLVVDHSVTAEFAGTPDAFLRNLALEYRDNQERYRFLRWAQHAFKNFRILPPGSGIVHQVNLEYLARPIWSAIRDGQEIAYPDSLVGMDSHTPMVNALGVFGWGVGGIEAASAMLGEPVFMQVPEVVGCRLVGSMKARTTATDVVLMVTERLRAKGVIGTIVEFHGPGVAALSLPDRATISNMAPEYGATMGFFPVDAETLSYLAVTGRAPSDIVLAEAYCREQGLWRDEADDLAFSDEITLDLSVVEPSMAGPRRPQDRHPVSSIPSSFTAAFNAEPTPEQTTHNPERALRHGDVVIAAITSCTNTSHPGSMISAGLLARNAAARGLRSKPWVKTSLSPGSRVVTEYLQKAGLMGPLESLGFYLAGYGCMTCAGGSGSLAPEVAQAIDEGDLVVTAMLSSNRNFEGRIHPQVRAAYIGSPALVVAFALAGSALVDLDNEPVGHDAAGKPVHLRDLWPDRDEVARLVDEFVSQDAFRATYAAMFEGDEEWRALPFQAGDRFAWNEESQYLRRPPLFDDDLMTPATGDILGARILLMLGDSITTDHISPAAAISKSMPAGEYLISRGVQPEDFHSYMARRGNHEIMIRGTYANIRLKNEMTPDAEGGVTVHVSSGERLSVYDAAMRYRADGVPAVVVAGTEYGTGSSRDWAAKGVRLLGIRAILAESFERIHRSNLVGMGVLPLQFPPGVTRKTLRLTGHEAVDIRVGDDLRPGIPVECTFHHIDGSSTSVVLRCRLDTVRDVEWYAQGGVLPYVAGKLLRSH